MSVEVNIKLAIPVEDLVAIKTETSDYSPIVKKLARTAPGAIINAIKALPINISPNSGLLEINSPAASTTTTSIPVFPPARPVFNANRNFSPRDGCSFYLRILRSNGNGLTLVDVSGRLPVFRLAQSIKGNSRGFVILTCKGARIYDERWEDADAVAFKLTLDNVRIQSA